jgi:hypothetical protein
MLGAFWNILAVFSKKKTIQATLVKTFHFHGVAVMTVSLCVSQGYFVELTPSVFCWPSCVHLENVGVNLLPRHLSLFFTNGQKTFFCSACFHRLKVAGLTSISGRGGGGAGGAWRVLPNPGELKWL